MVFQKGGIKHYSWPGVRGFCYYSAPCLLSETGPSEYGLNGARRCFFFPVLSGNYSVDSPFGLQVYVVVYDIFFSFLYVNSFFLNGLSYIPPCFD
jgi:hypothetical protein